MTKIEAINELKASQKFFETSTSCLTDEDSSFTPKEGLYTVANHVAHVAQTIDWFFYGAYSEKGFDMDFDKHIEETKKVISYDSAKDWFNKAIENAIKVIEEGSEEDFQKPIAEGTIMGGAPRYSIIGAITEHTAHHRGTLSVYSRLIGKEPKMPYM
ncbi:MAG: DinB family protein [Ignavibacteria bacterium]|jgi:uncharacterized damage-inducible protein DinB